MLFNKLISSKNLMFNFELRFFVLSVYFTSAPRTGSFENTIACSLLLYTLPDCIDVLSFASKKMFHLVINDGTSVNMMDNVIYSVYLLDLLIRNSVFYIDFIYRCGTFTPPLLVF